MRNDESLVATWALDFRALKSRGGRDSLVAGWALENNVCHRGERISGRSSRQGLRWGENPWGEGAGGECRSSAFVESGEPVGKVGERGAGVYFWGKIFFKSV